MVPYASQSERLRSDKSARPLGGVTKSVIGAGAGSSGWWLCHCPCLVCDQQTDEESARRTLETYADLVSLESPEFDRGMKAVV
jgi:hypothetical protein